ncbi:TATA box-binding protein-associated factor, RNA polymerase I, subunit C-like [Lingula anatina]|uniref:TATA box-binding protein-associated factor, RNA polymerase I, subunit C-like n=1 Tax=Lingula anatina TaxID=7574 RepID=A0A1S3IX48_LINAN|nr:TATA box-binding protein-associated factor, RNA polymerase I, subunit C-like [Lingula anatina]|eukprot:XP_013402613.1 TATA box-binding protein-associated factor, RNA polymerase I, subunit C-like [Lingula anatina]
MSLPDAHFPWAYSPHRKERDLFAEYGSHGAVDVRLIDGQVKVLAQKLHQIDVQLKSSQPFVPFTPPNFVPCPWSDRCMGDLHNKRKQLAELYYRIKSHQGNVKHSETRWTDLKNSLKRLQCIKESEEESSSDIDLLEAFMLVPKSLRQLISDVKQCKAYTQLPVVNSAYTGGCLAFCSQGERNLGTLIYLSGQRLENIVFDQVSVENSGIKRTGQSSHVQVSGVVREIASYNFQCAVRTENEVQIFSADNNYGVWERKHGLKFTDDPSSIALSPFIKGDVLVANRLGTVRLWTCGHQPKVVCEEVGTRFSCNESWRQCHFGAHPRLGVLADRSGVGMFDMRVQNCQDVNDLFVLPSKHLSVKERVMATKQHPESYFYHVVATDYSLILVDERFCNVPVLQWNHSLLTPPQYMDIVASVDLHGTEEDILLLSSQESCETNCFQFSVCHDTHARDSHTPQATCPMWRSSKISDFTCFPNIAGADKAVIEQRLEAMSLMGVCGVRHLDGKGLSIFQMNSLGDVMHQPYTPSSDDKLDKTFSAGPGSSSLRLSKEVESECVKWLKELQRQVDLTPVTTEGSETYDAFSSLDAVTVQCYPHIGCSLCMPQTSTHVELTQQTEEETCMACELKLKIGQDMQKACQSGELLNLVETLNSSVNIDHILPSINVSNFKDPTSQLLVKEWEGDGEIQDLLKERDELFIKNKEAKLKKKRERSEQNISDEFGAPDVPLPMKSRERLSSSSSRASSSASPLRTPGFLSTPSKVVQQSMSPKKPNISSISPLKFSAPIGLLMHTIDTDTPSVSTFIPNQQKREMFEFNTPAPSSQLFSTPSQTAVRTKLESSASISNPDIEEETMVTEGDMFRSQSQNSQTHSSLRKKDLDSSQQSPGKRNTSPKKAKKKFVMGF